MLHPGYVIYCVLRHAIAGMSRPAGEYSMTRDKLSMTHRKRVKTEKDDKNDTDTDTQSQISEELDSAPQASLDKRKARVCTD